MDPTTACTNQTPPETRKSWEEPRIVLERLLLVSAQEGPKDHTLPFSPGEVAPGGPSFLGPLGTSGGLGTC